MPGISQDLTEGRKSSSASPQVIIIYWILLVINVQYVLMAVSTKTKCLIQTLPDYQGGPGC